LKSKKVDNEFLDYTIKWSETLKFTLKRKINLTFDGKNLIRSIYRPFHKVFYYSDKKLSDRLTSNHVLIFGKNLSTKNPVIAFSGLSSSKPFSTLATDTVFSLDFLEKTQCLPLYRYDKDGNRINNITDWGYQQFKNHYTKGMGALSRYTEEELNAMNDDELDDVGLDEGEFYITKEYIFHYIYAVLHNPAYRKKYELNLKREFPRIPFYDDFHQWAKWGEQLMNLHINYETAEPFQLQIKNNELREDTVPKVKLKANREMGVIVLDEQTELHGIPAEAWRYKLGNRSAMEWRLDQYQERKPKDITVTEQFDTYRFADYKEQVIDMLKRVCTVSVETVKIIEEMKELNLKP
jgi:predicted helicase